MPFPTIDFETAWAGYRGWEHRLPEKPPEVETRRIAGVLEVADRYDLFVLDAFGVLNRGDEVLPEGLAAVRALRGMGKRVCVLTNDASAEPQALASRHARRGYDFQAGEIVSGLVLLAAELSRAAQGWTLVGTEAAGPRNGRLKRWDGSDAGLDAAEGFVWLETDDWDEARQRRFVESLVRRPRPVLVANPDVMAPYPDFLSADPGWFVNRAADAAGVRPRFLGKPFPAVYEALFARYPEIPKTRILAVGDSPHTDVLGARSNGLDVLLVESGVLQGRDALALCREAGLLPTYLAASI
jgi:ribonucleotide monophosphatase NagD (HAD superfamily)